MRLARHGLIAFFALALAGACSSKDDASAEAELQSAQEFCEKTVTASCGALVDCCANGTKFDSFECRRVQLASCFDTLGVHQITAGQLKFDSAAAAICLAPITACPSAVPSPSGASREKMIACQNVLTGQAPLGAGCTNDSNCAAVGADAYPSCYRPQSMGTGVCAKTVFSTDNSCGFFADALEHRLCPEDKQCVIPETALPPEDAQGKARFDVRGTCKPLAQVGQPCGPSETGNVYIECAKGLVCKYTGAAQPVCAQPKMKGQDCTGHDECADGLICSPDTFLCDDITDSSPKPDGLYCYVPTNAGGPDGGQGGAGGGPGCSSNGDDCMYDNECCSGSCGGGTCMPAAECLDDGAFCTSSEQCCYGPCNNNECNGSSTCAPQFDSCTSSDDCCSGLYCNSNMCM